MTLPEKKYYTIGEVADHCQLKPHVLRYWEQVFRELKPIKRRGRRYYQRKDIQLILKIRQLLYDRGYTISGAKSQLRAQQLAMLEVVPEKAEESVVYSPLDPLKEKIQDFKAELRRFLD